MATVHLVCGLPAAGKTTLAVRLAEQLPAVRFTLDEWVLRLHGLAYDDPSYPEAATRCQEVIWLTAVQVLDAGVDVVLDWNAWSRARRAQWRDAAAAAGHQTVVHHLTAGVDVAARQAEARVVDPALPSHRIDLEGVAHLAGIFEAPSSDEGIGIVEHAPSGRG